MHLKLLGDIVSMGCLFLAIRILLVAYSRPNTSHYCIAESGVICFGVSQSAEASEAPAVSGSAGSEDSADATAEMACEVDW